MMTGSTVTKRRTLLQRGFALLAGGAALAGGTRWATASPPTAASPSLTLYARRRPAAGPSTGPGAHHAAEGRIVASGDLLDGPDGARIGAFHTNCFCPQSPFGPQPVSASNLEFHVLQLNDGTLFAIGSGLEDTGAGAPVAIVGGTGRYAGRSGSYIQRAIADTAVGADVRQLMITFAG